MAKVVPSPTVLATRICPPWAAAIARVMVSPRPTPGTANWVAVDARKNRENSWSISCAGMPMPVSLTEIATRSPPSASGCTPRPTATRPPGGVNLIALEIRLSTACPSRTGSPTRPPGRAVSDSTSRTVRASATGWRR